MSASIIRFVLNGNIVETDIVDPTRTVLQFLREDLALKGTKEGCAEGDCGACTVVVVEIDRSGDDIELKTVNACIQFLPTIDGKELITVEGLRGKSGDLHPVQQAMVDSHGSQCGFCTQKRYGGYAVKAMSGRLQSNTEGIKMIVPFVKKKLPKRRSISLLTFQPLAKTIEKADGLRPRLQR